MSPHDARACAYRLHEAPEIAVHDVLENALRTLALLQDPFDGQEARWIEES